MMRHSRPPSANGLATSPASPASEEPTVPLTEGEFYFDDEGDEGRTMKKKRGLLKRLPRRVVPLFYSGAHLAMFVLIVTTNRVIEPSQLLTDKTGSTMMVLLFATALTYLYLLYSDPGHIRSKREHQRGDSGVDGAVINDASLVLPKGTTKQLCKTCYTTQPLRAKHCTLCDRCTYTYDHHCWWLNSCIGGRNKPEFLLFLYLQTILTAGSLSVSIASIRFSVSLRDVSIWTVVVLTGFVLVWVVKLTFLHTKLVLRNQTSHEYFRPSQCVYLNQLAVAAAPCCQKKIYFFNKGVASNLMTFMFRRPVQWEFLEVEIPQRKRKCSKKCRHEFFDIETGMTT